ALQTEAQGQPAQLGAFGLAVLLQPVGQRLPAQRVGRVAGDGRQQGGLCVHVRLPDIPAGGGSELAVQPNRRACRGQRPALQYDGRTMRWKSSCGCAMPSRTWPGGACWWSAWAAAVMPSWPALSLGCSPPAGSWPTVTPRSASRTTLNWPAP